MQSAKYAQQKVRMSDHVPVHRRSNAVQSIVQVREAVQERPMADKYSNSFFYIFPVLIQYFVQKLGQLKMASLKRNNRHALFVVLCHRALKQRRPGHGTILWGYRVPSVVGQWLCSWATHFSHAASIGKAMAVIMGIAL